MIMFSGLLCTKIAAQRMHKKHIDRERGKVAAGYSIVKEQLMRCFTCAKAY
jgi:hypothetical protein